MIPPKLGPRDEEAVFAGVARLWAETEQVDKEERAARERERADGNHGLGMRFEGLGRLDVHFQKPSELVPQAAGVQGPPSKRKHAPVPQCRSLRERSTIDAT